MRKIIVLIGALGIIIGVNAQKKVKLEDNTNANNLIYKNGELGIGIISPLDAKLHIKGDYNIRIDPSQGISPFYYITSNSANNIIGTNIRTKFGAWDVPDKTKPSSYIDFDTYNINNPTYGGISFLTRTAGDQSDLGSKKMTILNNGNIGIGTISPDMKLTVNGNIHAKEVKIDLNVPAPDYVFKKDYNLITIEEVEKFIKKNSHLPEIPSAEEFEENGVMQAEMDMNLLKKIEELTLYTIQQQKEIEKLKKENTELKSLSDRLVEIEKLLESKK
ncbi:hypothetical protein [Aquimarina macrocephali]|uniref:hypothetical protein n=1 Tax=Aquimarina macrocephali TaxID=666563 RepID=UPI003F66F51A